MVTSWFATLGWVLAGIFLGRWILTRRHLKAVLHDIELIKLFVSTGDRP